MKTLKHLVRDRVMEITPTLESKRDCGVHKSCHRGNPPPYCVEELKQYIVAIEVLDPFAEYR